MRRLLILMAWLSLLVSAGASAFTKPPFPRLALDWIADQRYQDPTVQQQLARGSIALVNIWPGWEVGAGTTLEQVIKNIKAINPKTLVFDYINNNEINTSFSSYAEVINKLNSMHWYLYPSGTIGTPVPSAWPGATAINNTMFTAPDSNGDNWIHWYAKWVVKNYYLPNPSLDGFGIDNVFTRPRVTGDWNLDGIPDLPGGLSNSTGQWIFITTPAQQWLQQGYVEHFRFIRTLMPGKYQIGNVGDWGDPNSNLTLYQGQLDGGFLDTMIGKSWSPETWGGWQFLMSWYRKTMSALGEPKLAMFMQVGSTTDYQGFRYGLASCLMDDGYFIFHDVNGNGGDAPWFDEYAYQGKLGYATTAPPTTAYQNGVYRRDFENGIALVNPKGNGAQTITLETDFVRISGTQAPTVNSGQTVRSLTLQDRDGIILMRVQPQPLPAKPEPPSNVTVH